MAKDARNQRPGPKPERDRGRLPQASAPRPVTARRWLTAVYVAVALLALVGAAYAYNRMTVIPGLEVHPDEGATHVPEGTAVQYQTDPPTSGPHYERLAPPGFYDRPVDPRQLVHNLEHGHVVIYYDARRLSERELAAIRQWTERYRGTWDAVMAVPREDRRHAVILTAWRHALRLEKYDETLVRRFIDRFRGRGPENPIR